MGNPTPEAVGRLKGVNDASILRTDEEANGSVTARISVGGVLTWRKSKQLAWWAHGSGGQPGKQTGICGGKKRP